MGNLKYLSYNTSTSKVVSRFLALRKNLCTHQGAWTEQKASLLESPVVSSVELDLHATSQVSAERTSLHNWDLTSVGCVVVVECRFEVLVNVILSSFALESKMRINNFVRKHFCLHGLKDEISGWLAFIGSLLSGIVFVH